MAPAPSKAHRLARLVGIDPDYRRRYEPEEAINSTAQSMSEDVELFIEDEPTVAEWLKNHAPTAANVRTYLGELLPFWSWIFHYNGTWLLGDIIAGKLNSQNKPEEYGLCAIPYCNAMLHNNKQNYRRYRRLCGDPPRHGLRPSCTAISGVWAVHIFRRLSALLGFRN